VVVSGIQSLVGILHYVVKVVSLTEHYIFTFYKINAVSDLVLLTGIAILLRPVQQQSTYSLLADDNRGPGYSRSYHYIDAPHAIGGNPVEGETPDYSLLLEDESEAQLDGDSEGQVGMEMTSHASISTSTNDI
jgi:hypothetical protein